MTHSRVASLALDTVAKKQTTFDQKDVGGSDNDSHLGILNGITQCAYVVRTEGVLRYSLDVLKHHES
jgi:hypothetical protein